MPPNPKFTVFPMYGVAPTPGISGISSTRSIVIVWAQNLAMDVFFAPTKRFVHPSISLRMLRAFSGGLSVLKFRTILE